MRAALLFFFAMGCGGATTVASMPSSDPAPLDRPEEPADRARRVLADLADFCRERGEECVRAHEGESADDGTRRYLDRRRDELRTLGFRLRWDPSDGTFEVEPGNDATLGGDLGSDP